jgi:flagellar basal-body rod protein FlgB
VLDDLTTQTISTALAAISERQRVSADNIANLETPGYQAQQVSFEDSLRAAVAAGTPGAASATISPTGGAEGVNGNNVSLDTEMLTDTKSQMQYSLLSTAMSAKFDLISDAIKD